MNRMMQGLAIAMFAVLVLGLCGCAGGDTSSPENVVKAYHEASKAKDKERLKKLLSKEDLANWKEDASEKAAEEDTAEYKIGATKIEGTGATVEVTYTRDGKETSKIKYQCVKEDDQWKLALGKTFKESFKDLFKDAFKDITGGNKE
ncbi:MAG: DUF4878 domain-containing protein [Planctomycetes bacterium]|nr:DUF4878 domain-containing protein [Planctomycetota bacterium]